MLTAMYGNRSLFGRQLRVDSFGRSGAAVEIGLGGRYEAIQGVLNEQVCQSLHDCTICAWQGEGGEKFLR